MGTEQSEEGTGSPDTSMRGTLTTEDLELTPLMGEKGASRSMKGDTTE